MACTKGDGSRLAWMMARRAFALPSSLMFLGLLSTAVVVRASERIALSSCMMNSSEGSLRGGGAGTGETPSLFLTLLVLADLSLRLARRKRSWEVESAEALALARSFWCWAWINFCLFLRALIFALLFLAFLILRAWSDSEDEDDEDEPSDSSAKAEVEEELELVERLPALVPGGGAAALDEGLPTLSALARCSMCCGVIGFCFVLFKELTGSSVCCGVVGFCFVLDKALTVVLPSSSSSFFGAPQARAGLCFLGGLSAC